MLACSTSADANISLFEPYAFQCLLQVKSTLTVQPSSKAYARSKAVRTLPNITDTMEAPPVRGLILTAKKRDIEAASQVLNTYELLESILSCLLFRDLTRAQRVAKQWRNVSIRSADLREQLDMFTATTSGARDAATKHIEVHPLVAVPGYRAQCDSPLPLLRLWKLLALRSGLWETMLISVPPVTIVKINGIRECKTRPVIVEDADGIRFEKLIAGLKQWIAADYTANARVRWTNRESDGHTRWALIEVMDSGSWPCSKDPCSLGNRYRVLCDGAVESAAVRCTAFHTQGRKLRWNR